MGGKLGGGKVVTAERVTDGPFAEAKEIVGGFMIVSADTLEEAVEVARQSPGTWSPGSSVEVREIETA
ncbi:MAG TPA: YciI family protein [Verrucomicrobiota bacterium]|nr:YciI family protein [Verrucomicrobiota bacterium]HPU57467.1 YciI family protein [Verrucomicrobiota bacterium]